MSYRTACVLPTDRPAWTYCATGARAAMAVSLLDFSGREAVLVDDLCLPGDVPGKVGATA